MDPQALVVNKRGLNQSWSSARCGGAEPVCLIPFCWQLGRAFSSFLSGGLSFQTRNYILFLSGWGGGKIFLVKAYLFVLFSSDIFSSQKAMPRSFPNIYKDVKVVPLIQNSQEFS